MEITINYKKIRILILIFLFIFILFSYKNVFAQSSSIELQYDVQNYRLDKSIGNSWANWPKGTLTFPFAIYDYTMQSMNTPWSTQVPSSVYVTANNGINYTCSISGVSNPAILTPSNYGDTWNATTQAYSASCNVEPGSTGITAIHIVGLGAINSSHIRIYGNLSFITETNNTQDIINNQNSNTQSIVDSQNQINDTINNDDVSGADSSASGFFSDFQTSSHNGISGIITSPLRLVQALTGNSCTELTIPLPFVNENITLPCMSSIYSTYFPDFLTLYRIITTGIIAYWVVINIFAWVRRLERPDDDRIEVLNL